MANTVGEKYVEYCSKCNATADNLLTCSKCCRMKYCNATCQKTHWPDHKADCKELVQSIDLYLKKGFPVSYFQALYKWEAKHLPKFYYVAKSFIKCSVKTYSMADSILVVD